MNNKHKPINKILSDHSLDDIEIVIQKLKKAVERDYQDKSFLSRSTSLDRSVHYNPALRPANNAALRLGW